MKKIYYEKRGRRYTPVAEWDSQYLDSFPKGNHLVMCYPGGQSRKYNIEPEYAALIAAGREAENSMISALIKAGELRLAKGLKEKKMTQEQKDAWDHLIKVFGDEARQLEWPSAREVVEIGMKTLQEEANKLLSNESVRKAYDHFMLICKLTKENNAQTN